MKKSEYHFSFDVYDSIDELAAEDAALLQAARKATQDAYAPYSRFRVAAAARLENGQLVTGSNQENASFPAGICAERVLLSAVSAQWPGVPIRAIAITYLNELGKSDHPASPCGICRQSLQEYEQRFKSPIRLILAGQEGPIHIVNQSGFLLPFAFEFNANV